MAYTYRIVCLLIVRCSLPGCSRESPEPLRVGTNVRPVYEPLYLARELGYFGSAAVHLVKFTSTSQVIHAYCNKVIEAAAMTLDEVLLVNQYSDQRPTARLLSAKPVQRLSPGF